MANLTISNVFNNLKNPAIVAGGFMVGVTIQKLIDKALNTEAVTNGLGAENVGVLKQYATPVITAILGVGASIASESDLMKKLSTGVAISGAVGVGYKMIWGKSLLAGTDGGLLGSIMGDDTYIEGVDDDEIEGIDDDEIEGYDEVEAIEGLDIPFTPPALRDTAYERETVSGYNGYGMIQ